MSLKVNTHKVGSVSVIDLHGRITLGEGSGTLREAVKSAMDNGEKQIVLNMGDVSYIDSAGLGELVGSYTTVSNSGGQLRLANVQKKMKDLMQITKLYTIFQAYDSETEAIQSFGGSPASA